MSDRNTASRQRRGIVQVQCEIDTATATAAAALAKALGLRSRGALGRALFRWAATLDARQARRLLRDHLTPLMPAPEDATDLPK
jgi:uncharacterized membrane protein